MPHDARLVDQHLVEKDSHGQHDIVLLEKHEAPASADGGLAPDQFYEFDRWTAQRVMVVLKRFYPGHFWCVVSDRAQGVVKISIPILMGVSNWYVINLKQTDLTPGAVIYAGGEILERYSLGRGRFHLPSFLEARQKQSALLVPSRKVPE